MNINNAFVNYRFYLRAVLVSSVALAATSCTDLNVAGITPLDALEKKETLPKAEAPAPSYQVSKDDLAAQKRAPEPEDFVPLAELPPVPNLDVTGDNLAVNEGPASAKEVAEEKKVDITRPSSLPLVRRLENASMMNLNDLPPLPDESHARPAAVGKKTIMSSPYAEEVTALERQAYAQATPRMEDLPFVQGEDAYEVLSDSSRPNDLEVVSVSLMPDKDPFAPTIGAYKMLPIDKQIPEDSMPVVSPEFKGKLKAPLPHAVQPRQEQIQHSLNVKGNMPKSSIYSSEEFPDKGLMVDNAAPKIKADAAVKVDNSNIIWEQSEPVYSGKIVHAHPAPATLNYAPVTEQQVMPQVQRKMPENTNVAWQEPRKLMQPERTMKTGSGIIISEGKLVQPSMENIKVDADCKGYGVGVEVNSATTSHSQLLDANGKPCAAPEVLFDGNSEIDTRAPVNQGIKISVHNPFSKPKEDKRPKLPPFEGAKKAAEESLIPTYPEEYVFNNGENVKRPNVPEFKVNEVAMLPQEEAAEVDGLSAAVASWSAQQEEMQKTAEQQAFAEDLVDIRRYSSGQLAMEYQRQVDELMKRLREAEIREEMQAKQQAQLISRLQSTENKTEADRENWRDQERELRAARNKTGEELAQIKSLNDRLKMDYARKEQEYQKKIAKLSSDLQSAERQASKARQEMVLEAAQKIAEAERLAFAAKMAKRDQMERQAMRLKLEGDMLMRRADDLETGRSVMVPGLSEEFNENFPDGSELAAMQPAAKPVSQSAGEDKYKIPPLGEVPVIIHAEDKTLKEIFAQIFTDLRPVMGEWSVAWELSGKNQGILEEEWSVTAESTFKEFLGFVASKMQDLHGVELKFAKFDKSRRFVISD